MKTANNNALKFCFIGNSDQNYLADYIHLTRYDQCENLTFGKLKLIEIKCFDPHYIIIDQYFSNGDYSSLIESIKLNFKNVKIYFLSPQYSKLEGVIQSEYCKNHYFSGFSSAILDHINLSIGKRNDQNNYLEAG